MSSGISAKKFFSGELGKDGIGADVRFDEVAVYGLSETAEYVIG